MSVWVLATGGMIAGCGPGEPAGPWWDASTGPAAPTSDAGGGPVARPAAPGAVELAVTSTAWTAEVERELAVGVSVSNGAGAEPARLTPGAFTLETSAGAIVDADARSELTCPSGISVAPGATLGCRVRFAVPTGHAPTVVHYRTADGRHARAPVLACATETPHGLCPEGSVCWSGACETPCSPTAPTGPCASPEDTCVAGSCRPPCSPTVPDGYCAEGACIGGRCDASCLRLELGRAGCLDCVQRLVDTGTCLGEETSATCNDPEACTGCAIEGSPSCECAASWACEGCATEVLDAVTCVAGACPSCLATD